MLKKILISLVILVIFITIIVFKFKTPPISIQTVKVFKSNIEDYISEDAKTYLQKEHIIYTTIDGNIVPTPFEEGDFINKGQVIARLDNYNRTQKLNSLNSKLNELEAMVEGVNKSKIKQEDIDTAKLRIKQSQNSINEIIKQKNIIKINLEQVKNDYLRNKKLLEQESINKNEFEKSEANYKIQKTSLENIKTQEIDANSNIRINQLTLNKLLKSVNDNDFQKKVYIAQMNQIKDEINIINNEIFKTTLLSDFSGVVLEVYLKDKTTVPSGSKLLKIGDFKSIVIQSDILTEEITKIKIGMKVEVTGKALNNKKIFAKVSKIYPTGFTKVSSLGVEQQRIKVNIDFDNTKLNLKPETNLDIKIITKENKNTLVIPERSIFKDKNKWYVFKVNNLNKLEQKEVKIGLKNEDNVEIINGLNEKEIIVLEPDNKIKEGIEITPN
ncbi:MAG: efflux RND transporter periplasmic adaptor subunit [Candidatus Sericytochromatia bacterium]